MSWLLRRIDAALGRGTAAYSADIPFATDPCDSCDQPCAAHAQVPDYLKIDTESTLVGTVKPYARHILYVEGSAKRWPSKIDQATGSLGAELTAGAKAAGEKLGYRIVVTACDTTDAALPRLAPAAVEAAPQPAAAGAGLPAPEQAGQASRGYQGAGTEGVQLLLFPEMRGLWLAKGLELRSAITEYYDSGSTPQGAALCHLAPAVDGGSNEAGAAPQPPAAHGAGGSTAAEGGVSFILVCAHKLRDKRCGVVGPLLVDAFRQAAQARGLQDKVFVYPVSHTGGHKFAGNVIIYPGGHWYGRVTPCHVDGIMDKHVIEGKVIKDLWRGQISGAGNKAAGQGLQW